MHELKGDGTWPFTAIIDGDDIVVNDVVITCFGGAYDPQDSGETASGANTKKNPCIAAVALPMDVGNRCPNTKGSPIPNVPWGTPVAVTIGGHTVRFGSGVIDLGPGKQASRRGEPHALDLTPPAAAVFSPGVPLRKLAATWSARGSYRILGAAKYAPQ